MSQELNAVVCKLQCHLNVEVPHSDDGKHSIRLGAVYEGYEKDRLTENAIFGKYTPFAEFSMSVSNHNASSFFRQGRKYYVTFTEAPD